MIKINRVTDYADKLRKYKIMLDDEQVSEIRDGETKSIELAEGNHNIYLKIDWCRSNKIDFYITEGQVIEFDCGCSVVGWRKLIALIYITFLKNQYLWLKMKDKR